MMNWIDLISFSFAVCGLLVAVMGLYMNRTVSYLDRRSRMFFVAVFSLVAVYNVSSMISSVSLVFLGASFRSLSVAAVLWNPCRLRC